MKHKWWKRVLALLLTVVMVSTTLPMSVFAAQADETEEQEETLQTVLTWEGWSYTVQEDGTALICGAPEGQDALEIPAQVDGLTVKAIAEEAFAYHGTVTAIAVPETVTAVENSAFYHCENLRAVAFMGDVPSFGFTVAEGCGALEAVFVQESCDYGYFCALLVNDLGEDGAAAVKILEFAGAEELKSSWTDYLALMENGAVPLTTGEGAVVSESDFTIVDGVLTAYNGEGGEVVIPDGVTVIGAEVFYDNRTITSVIFPDSLTEIGTQAFFFCQNLKSVTFGSGLKTIGERAFEVTGIAGELILPEGLTGIGDYAFSGCNSLSSLTLPSTLTDMGFDAFGSCGCLESVTISDGVTTIGDYAFSSCSSLRQISIPDSVTSIGEWAFYSCQSLRTLVLPPNLKSIGGKVVGYWGAVNLFFTGSTVPEVQSDTFVAYGLESIYVPEQALSAYQAAWGSLLPSGVTIKTASMEGDFVLSDGILVGYNGSGGDVVIPDGVTAIANDVFVGNQSIVSVTMPDSVTTIENSAFNCCFNLKSVTFGTGLKSIGDYAFTGCESLSQLSLPAGLETIGDGAFNSCTGLTGELILPASLTCVGYDAFNYCCNLTGLTVAGTNLEIGMYAFSGCMALTSLDIQDGVAVIGDGVFNGCSALTKVTIPASVTNIGAYAFGYLEALTEIYFLGDAPAIGEDAFGNVIATCYYPANNSTWDISVTQDYGGMLTWEAFLDTIGPEMELVSPAAGSSIGGVVTFKVKVSDAICVETVTMYTSWLKLLGKYSWSEFETKSVNAGSATVEFAVDIAALNLKTETLYVKFNAVDAAGNETELSAVEYTVLTTPDPPECLGAVSTQEGIELVWTHSDTSIDMYKICRSEDYGEYEQIALIMEPVNGYTDTEVVAGHTYSYQVYAGVIKIGDAFSEPATVSDVVHVDYVKPTIESITPANGSTLRGEVEFTVSVTDNCGLLMLKMIAGQQSQEVYLGGLEATETFSVDTTNYEDGTLSVTITVNDFNGLSTTTTCTYTIDNVPDEPEGLSAKSEENGISLSWNGSDDDNVASYVVERSVEQDSGYEILTTITTPQGSQWYTDTDSTLIIGETYYYRVKAVSAAGVASSYAVVQVKFEDIVVPTITLAKVSPTVCGGRQSAVVSVAAEDKYGIAKVELGRRISATYFTTVGIWEFDGSEYQLEIDVSAWLSGEYELYIKVYDVHDNYAGETVALTVDNDGPQITDLAADWKENGVSVSWDCADLDDIASLEVYRGQGADNEIVYERIAEMVRPSECVLLDEVLEAEGVYYYYVAAKDALGNEYQTEPVFVTVDYTAPEILSVIPADLAIIYGSATFTVSMRDNCALESIEMVTSTGAVAGALVSGVEAVEEFTVDTTDLEDGNLTVTFVVTDSCGNQTEQICTYTIDNIPEVPTNLTAISEKTCIVLNWKASGSPNLDHYIVERSAGDTTEFVECKTISANTTTWRDNYVAEGTTYYYRVLVVSSDGAKSECSNVVECKFEDIVVPVISWLEITPAICGGTLKASIYVDAIDRGGIERIELSYSSDGENFEEITVLDDGGTYAWDVSGLPSGDYIVKAVPYDVFGNVGQGTTAAVTVDNTVPAKIVGVAAIGDVLDIKVTWAIAAEADTQGYRVYRRAEGESEFQVAAQIDGRSNLSWTDTEAEEAITYEYYVVGVNYIDQDGEASDVVSAARIPDEEAPVVTKIEPDNGGFVSGTVEFTVAAQDNVGVTALHMYFSHDGGETWNLVWESDSGNATLGFDTASMADGIFKVKGVAWDAAGNQSAEVVHTYSVDNTGPAAPGEFSYESTTVTVTLRWTESVDEDVKFYRVEKRNDDGSYATVTDVATTLGANITGLTPGTQYTYRVVGYDQQGNRGIATEDLVVTTLQDTNAPVITLLRPTSGWYKDKIDLTVTASDDYTISAITVQTSADGTAWADVHTQTYSDIAAKRTLSWTMELADYEEGALYVRALATDGAGNGSDSSESAPFVQHKVDRTAPGAPEGVSAAGYLGYVEVVWTAGDESGLNYSVYRAAAGSETFVLLKSGLSTVNYIDYDVEQGASYEYKVTVCDAAGNCSAESEVVTAEVPKDVTAPEITVTPGDGTTLGTGCRTIRVTVVDDLAVYKIAVKYSIDGVDYTVLSQVSDVGSKSRTVTVNIPLEALTAETIYVQAVATDEAGNEAEPVLRQYAADKTAPVVVSAQASYADNGVAVSWVGAEEEDLVGYKVYRSSNGVNYSLIAQRQAVSGQTTYSCNDYNLALTQTTYTYKVEAIDTLGNTSTLTTTAVTVPDRSAPKPVLACEATMEVGVEYIIDASRSTDDSKVAAWHFDFGDGTQSEEATPVHAYAQTGEYVLTLTVTDDAGNTATLMKNITVRERTLIGTVEITVVDQDGVVVPNAPVHFDLGSEDQVIRVTNSAGKVTFTGQVGHHKVGCIIPDNNWLTTITDVVVTAGETTAMTMTMVRETMIEGEFEIRQMTRTEIIAAGINPDAPENQYIVQVNVSLTYGTEKVESTFMYNPGTGTSTAKPVTVTDSDDGTQRQLVPVVILPEEVASEPGYEFSREASVAYLDIPVGMSALKDFFEVKLHIINNDSEDSAMVDNVVQLNVPNGLTLMDTYVSQASPTVTIAEIRGQSAHTVKWILRGDQVGEYYLTADFTGTLDEFGWTISTQFVADEPLVVTGLSDLLMTIEIPEELDNGTLYYNVSLTNLGYKDINDPKLETGHDLIETVLYNDAGIATSIVGELETLPGGYCLTKHYMEVDQTDYTELDAELQSFAYHVGETYGMEILILKKPISYFKAALSPLENASAKADLTYTTNQSVYDYIMNHNNFVYWSMYESTGAVAGELTSNAEEVLWDGLKLLAGDGGLKELFGGEDEEFIRAIIIDAMELGVEGSEDAAAYVMFCKFLDKAMDVMEDMNLDEVFGEMADTYGKSLKETFEIVAIDFKWDFYSEGFKEQWGSTDDFVLGRWRATWNENYIVQGAFEETTASKFLHQLFSADGFEAVWEGIGFTADSIQAIQTAAELVKQDIGIYLAAQSTLDQCNLFLDALITYSTGVGDPQRVQSAAEEVKEAMNDLDVIGEMAREIAKEEFWVGADMGKDKLLDTLSAKAPKIALKIKIVLKITTYVGDNLFNVSERHNIADNIRFVSIMSDSIWYQIQVYHELYKGYPDDIYAQPYMQLLAYLINLRAIGESQVAHFGVSYEVLEGVFDSEDLLVAVRNMSEDTKEAESWIQWRDIVEDKISRARVQLLKNPLAVDVNERSAPVVTFDYTKGQTAQSFSSDYEYSIDRGATWIVCDGGPIQLDRQPYSYQLWVRGVAGGNAPEKRTADIWISSPYSLSGSVQVMQTPDGYRITGLDSYKQYQVTFSNDDRYMDYDEQLDITIPAGSSSYEYATGAQYTYAHIRSLATGTAYASYIACRTMVNMLGIQVTQKGGGTVTGAGSYEYGSQVTLTATPAIAFDFAGWYEGDVLVSGDSVLTLTADADRVLTALFIQREPPVEVILDDETANEEQVKLVFRESLDYTVRFLLVGYTTEGKMVRQGLYEFVSPDVGTEQLVDVTGWTDCAFITAFLVDEHYTPLMDSVDVR